MSVCYTLSFSANCSIFEVAAAAPDGLKFFQLYNCRSRDVIVEIIRMAEQCDFRAFVVTLDVPVLGNRTRDLRNRFVHSLKEAGYAFFVNLAIICVFDLFMCFLTSLQLCQFLSSRNSFI